MEGDFIAEHKVSEYRGGSQVNICNQEAMDILGVEPGEYVAVSENGLGLNVIPRKDKERKRHSSSVYPVEVKMSEFEARMIGNRLWKIGDHYEDRGEDHLAHECKWWARRFHDKCNSREKER